MADPGGMELDRIDPHTTGDWERETAVEDMESVGLDSIIVLAYV